MHIYDKHKVLSDIKTRSHIVLELGCGPKKKNPAAIGIDALDYECVDIVGDVFFVLSLIPECTIDKIETYHFLEHITNLERLINEINRILKPGGDLFAVTPHFSNPYFYSDYTHKTFFGLYTFSYFSIDNIFHRKVPTYNNKTLLELKEVKLVLSSPFRIRRKLKRLLTKIVNINSYTKEFYEENLTGIVPCYEIHFLLKKPSTQSD